MKTSHAVLLGSAVLGGAALVFRGQKQTASGQPVISPPPSNQPASVTNAAWQDYILTATQTRDPEQIRAAAKVLRANGMVSEAAALEAVAAAIEAANQGAQTVQASWNPQTQSAAGADPVVYQTPGVVQQQATAAKPSIMSLPPNLQTVLTDALETAAATANQAANAASGQESPPVPIPPASPLPPSDPLKAAAEGLNNHLAGKAKYQEDQKRVKAFQTLVGVKADGLYGPGTALKVAEQGVIPVKPLYWPKTGEAAAKQSYSVAILQKAAADPARAAAWTAAANVSGVALPTLPTVPTTSSPSPLPTTSAPAATPQAVAAQAMVEAIRGKKKWQEPQAPVKAFQKLVGIQADGKYGPGTGRAVAAQNVVPVPPLYWSSNATKAAADKVAWQAEMAARAATDPARSAQWLAAGKVTA